MRQIFADSFFYILYFQTPGVAEHELQSFVIIPLDQVHGAEVLEGVIVGGGGQAVKADGEGFIDGIGVEIGGTG